MNNNHTNNSVGRDSSLDSDCHSSILGVFGVPTKPLLTKFTGESITGLSSNTLPSRTSLFSKFKSGSRFFPISLQTLPTTDPKHKALLPRSWAKVPGFKYFPPVHLDFLLPFSTFQFLSFCVDLPIVKLWFESKTSIQPKNKEEA